MSGFTRFEVLYCFKQIGYSKRSYSYFVFEQKGIWIFKVSYRLGLTILGFEQKVLALSYFEILDNINNFQCFLQIQELKKLQLRSGIKYNISISPIPDNTN